MLAEADTRKLDEFYLLLVLKKLTEREELLEFLQTLKKDNTLRIEHLLECLWSLALYL